MEETQKTDEIGIEGEKMPSLSLNSKNFEDKLTQIACRQLEASTSFKKARMAQWQKFDTLYNGIIKKKLRVLFQVCLPVYSGMLDTLAASYDEPVEMEFVKKHPADHFKAKKTQAMWNMEKDDTSRNARWNYKVRIDKKLNIRYGRSILKSFAESDPKYRFVLENTDPMYFHCQPTGGGLLENHLFCGEENVFKSEYEIRKGVKAGIYDRDQWKKLKQRTANREYMEELGEDHTEKMARFRSLGLDPEKDNYVGEARYNLVEWCLTYKGRRYYLLFDPWTKTWLRVCPLKELYSKELYPWTSWASHEDNRVFWSIGYGDILYAIADAIITLFNQELTNREKRNLGARGYDKDMIPDVAKLDAAQYRADALVPIDTKGGTRKISEGFYYFETPELQGTISLVDWIKAAAGKDTGITDIAQGASMDSGKKVNVAFMEQASVAKRIGYKSQSYTECLGEALGTRYIQGLKDHLGANEKKWIEVLGEDGLEPDVMTREDLYTENDLGVKVFSSTAQRAESEMKKKGRIDAMNLLAQSQNINSEMRDATILRDIGGYSESEIRQWFDTHNYASRDSIGKAHIAIQELLRGSKPDLNFAADVVFLQTIRDYAIEHRNKLGKEKFMLFMAYFQANSQIAQENEKQAATQRGQQAQRKALAAGGGGGGASSDKPPMSAKGPQKPGVTAVRQPVSAAQPEQTQ